MIGKIFVAAIKMLFRDRLSLFWSLIFPVMFVVIFGLFSFGEGPGSARVAIIDQAENDVSNRLVEGFREIEYFEFADVASEAAAEEAIRSGDLAAAIVIPPSFGSAGASSGDQPPTTELTAYYDKSSPIQYQIIQSVLGQIVSEINLDAMGVPKLLTLTEEAVQSRQFQYIDFLLPGIMGMGLMFNGLVGIATDISRYREQWILKRIRATPLPPGTFILAQVLAYLVVVVIQATLIILVARFLFDAHVYGSLIELYGVALIGTMIFLNIGFTIAGVSRTSRGANGLTNVIAFPMLFLSGTFFPTANLPTVIETVVRYLPLTPVMDAMRAISLNGEPLTALGPQMLLIGAWIVASFALAAGTFRFRET